MTDLLGANKMGHIDAKAGFIAALPKEDPERRAAEDHARGCVSCRDAMEEGKRLVELLSEALPLEPAAAPAGAPAAASAMEQVLRRQREADAADAAADQRGWKTVTWVATAALVLVWVLQLGYSKKLATDAQSVTVGLGILALLVAGVSFLRTRRRALVAGLVATSGLFAFAISAAAPLEPRIGLECSMCELVAAALPWLAVVLLARRARLRLDRWVSMAVAGAGALSSQAAQLLACPVPHARGHLLLFHFGGVLVAMALGALLAFPLDASVSVEP